MTKFELAAQLNGREYREEITPEEEKLAKDAGLVVIFGASDDLCEFRGAIDEEVGANNGVVIRLTKNGPLHEIYRDDKEILEKYGLLAVAEKRFDEAPKIHVQWAPTGSYSWVIETHLPRATFDILEDGQPYCQGIVIDHADLPEF